SATLPEGMAERLGLDPGEHEPIDVGSPFGYAANAVLYCATHMPDRTSSRVQAALHDGLGTRIGPAGGRTLALFTSYRAMDAAVDAVRSRISTPVLGQRDLPKPALVDKFASDESASLFATMGFWQGIDVPGRTLSL